MHTLVSNFLCIRTRISNLSCRQVSFANTILPSQQTYFVEIRGNLNPVPLSGPTLRNRNRKLMLLLKLVQKSSWILSKHLPLAKPFMMRQKPWRATRGKMMVRESARWLPLGSARGFDAAKPPSSPLTPMPNTCRKMR